MQNWKSRILMAAATAGALFGFTPAALGQDRCVAFSAPLHAYLKPDTGWIGQSWWVFGNSAPLYAYEVTTDAVYEKTEPDFILGTEKTTLDFGNGDSFQLITRWLAHHMTSKGAVSEVTEVGTITNGTGKFADVNGVFVSAGTAGPGMSGDQQTVLWLGSRQGTICGLPSPVTAPARAEEATSQARPLANPRPR